MELNIKAKKNGDWLMAGILAAIGFILVFIFFLPVLNSDDDVFLMYQLAGGFGERPTNLLHYDHVMHPWLGAILASLFRWQPNVNWYTGFFILCQYVSWSLLGRAMIFRFGNLNGLLVFILLFVLAGITGLQFLNMTSTAWLISIAGIAYLIIFPDSYLAVFLIMLLSSSIRLQIPILVVGLFIPIQWVRSGKFTWPPLALLSILLFSAFILNLTHKQYYISNIPGWEKMEGKRQDLFYAFNRPRDLEKNDSLIFENNVEKAFYQRLFLFSDSFPSADRIKSISRNLVRVRDFSHLEDRQALYWNWVAWRLYFVFILILLLLAKKQQLLGILLKRIWLPVLCLVVFYIFLFVFMKFTGPFFMAFILMFALQFVIAWPDKRVKIRQIYYYSLLFLFPLIWVIKRNLDANKKNVQEHAQFICAAKELARQNEHLFISTGDAVPLKFFSAFDLPVDYPLTNYIFKERVIAGNDKAAFKKFGLTGDLYRHLGATKLRFAGPHFPEFIQWANQKGMSMYFSDRETAFQCMEVRRLLMK